MDDLNALPDTPLVARASIRIPIARAALWEALLRPETLCEMLPLRAVHAPWCAGQPFRWTMEMHGGPRDVEGVVLHVEALQRLIYSYRDPLPAHAGEHSHRVALVLTDDAGETRLDVVQDNNLTQAALLHAEGGWRLALHNLRAYVTGARRLPR